MDAALPAKTSGRSPRKSPGRSPRTSLIISVKANRFFILFFLYLSVIPIFFLSAYHEFPTVVILVAVLMALCSFIPFAFNEGDIVVSEPVAPLLAAAMLASIVGVSIGSMYLYWAHVQPLRALVTTREYRNIYPQLPASTYADASFVKFTKGTKVDVSRAVSVKSLDLGFHTFCAAPVVNTANEARVEFWAVGVDCCGDKRNFAFKCGDVGISGARNGHVMADPTDPLWSSIGKYMAPPWTRRDIFKQALAKAEKTQGLVSSKEPLLVSWTSKTREDIVLEERIKIVICCLIFAAAIAVLARMLAKLARRFAILEQVAKTGETSPEAIATADVADVLNDMDDKFERLALAATKHIDRPPMSKMDTCLMGVMMPFAAMFLCIIVASFGNCAQYGQQAAVVFYLCMGFGVLALLSTPHRQLHGIWVIVVALLGFYIGHTNYKNNMVHYCAVQNGRDYTKVPADGHGKIFGDAGVLHFQHNTFLSQNSSVGFLYEGNVYCAAPILSRECPTQGAKTASLIQTDSQRRKHSMLSFLQQGSRMQLNIDTALMEPVDDGAPAPAPAQASPAPAPAEADCKLLDQKRVQFWAIGVNCCSGRKDFRCDGGQDESAHAGVVVHATGFETVGGARDLLFRAIAQSAAQYDLPTPSHSNTVMIRWGKDPKKMQSEWASAAAGMMIAASLSSLIVIAAVGWTTHIYEIRLRRRLRELEREAQGEDPVEADQTLPRFGGPKPPGSGRGQLVV